MKQWTIWLNMQGKNAFHRTITSPPPASRVHGLYDVCLLLFVAHHRQDSVCLAENHLRTHITSYCSLSVSSDPWPSSSCSRDLLCVFVKSPEKTRIGLSHMDNKQSSHFFFFFSPFILHEPIISVWLCALLWWGKSIGVPNKVFSECTVCLQHIQRHFLSISSSLCVQLQLIIVS